jgi:hypothetical protein
MCELHPESKQASTARDSRQQHFVNDLRTGLECPLKNATLGWIEKLQSKDNIICRIFKQSFHYKFVWTQVFYTFAETLFYIKRC